MIPQPINIPIGNRLYELVEDYVCPIDSALIVPKGFRYDGASVPRLLWTLTGIRPDGPYRAGSTIHDYIYRYGGRVPRAEGSDEILYYTRSLADRMFRDLLVDSGVHPTRAKLAWCGVRSLGWRAWKRK